MLLRNMKPVNVIQIAIVGFGDYWEREALKEFPERHLPLDYSISNNADTMGVSDQNWTFQKARFLYPGRSCHFSVTVESKPSCESRGPGSLAARKNRRNSRSNDIRPLF